MWHRWRLPWLLLPLAAAGAAAEDAPGSCPTDGSPCGGSSGAAAGGPGAPGAYYWPTQKGSNSRDGLARYQIPNLTDGPAWSWFDPFHDVIRASPLIDDKKSVYLVTVAGRIYKFSEVGVVMWERKLSEGVPTSGALHDGSLIVGSRSGHLLALDMETGADRWKASISTVGVTAADPSSIFVENGTVVAATHKEAIVEAGNSDVVAVRAQDGAFLWRFQPDQPTVHLQVSSPGDGTILFQDKAGNLYRLSLSDGSLVWKTGRVGSEWDATHTTGAAVYQDGKVFVVCNNPDVASGTLHAYGLVDGRQLWQVYLTEPLHQAPAVGPSPTEKDKSMVVLGVGQSPGLPPIIGATEQLGYWLGMFFHWLDATLPWVFGERPRGIAAYDTLSGRRLWAVTMDNYRRVTASGDSERVRQRYGDKLVGLNPNNDFVCLPGAFSQPIIGPDGGVYIGAQDGMIYSIRDANGNGEIEEGEASWFHLGDGIMAPPAVAPGMLAVAPCGGGLHVFR